MAGRVATSEEPAISRVARYAPEKAVTEPFTLISDGGKSAG